MAKNTQATANAKAGAAEQVIMEVGPNVKCVVVEEKAPAPKDECGYQIIVQPPAPKATMAYLVAPGAEVVLKGIDTDKAKIVQEGDNLRITTADGGEILLLDFVPSAKADNCTALTTEHGKVAGKKLLAGMDDDHAKVEPAAGPQATVRPAAPPVARGSGLQAPEVDSTFGIGDKVLSSVIGPFAIPFGRDSIEYKEYPIEAGAPIVTPPPGPNNPPNANDDSATVACTVVCGSSVTINALANDSDPDGNPLTITGVSGVNAAHGTATVVGNQIVFVPAAGFTGVTTFQYSISDGQGGTDTATITVTVTNTPPVANDDVTSTAHNTPVTVNVLANDTDAECPAGLTITGISGLNPALGTATIVNNQIVFTPANGVTGEVRFFYSIDDGCGGVDTAEVCIIVGNPPIGNNPPNANDDFATVACTVVCGSSVTINVLANDTDPNGDALTITGVQGVNAAHGTATIVGNQIVFVPAAGFTGQTTFQYTISDGQGGTDTANVTVTVTNTPPDANNDVANTAFNTPVTINVLANDTDAECPAGLTITSISNVNPAHGVATIVNGQIQFTPANGFSGTTTFTYTIDDGCGGQDTATVTVNVGIDPNRPPNANDDTATVGCVNALCGCGAGVTINVLANDNDPDGDTLTITAVGTPSNGVATLNADGTIGYRPNPGFSGVDSFTYTISDGNGGFDTATVTITVTNTPPDAIDDAASTAFQTPVAFNVLANDVDPDAGILQLNRIVSQPANGTISYDNLGNVVYTPNAGFSGVDTFVYEVIDGCGALDTATVTITVGVPPNNPPNANDDHATVACTVVCGSSVTINVLANDSDPDGNPLTITGIAGVNAAHGTATIVGNQIVFVPAAGFTGVTTFTYSISDGQGGTDTATVTVTVTNTPPDANNDAATTAFQTQVTINVLANDTDAECPAGLAITGVSGVNNAHGTAAIVNGQIVFTPAAGFTGVTSFQYSITDGCGGYDTATVTVTVGTPPNNPPVANPDTATVACTVVCGSSVTINVLANDSDPNGDPLTVTGLTGVNPAHGTATIVGNQIVFVPAAGFTGQTTFNYSISDGQGGTASSTVTVTVTNTPPVANDDITATAHATPVTINVLANDTDAECPAGLTVTGITGLNPALGTATIVNNQIVFTPAAGVTGEVKFFYTIDDGCGGTDFAEVCVIVSPPPNNPPDARDDFATVKCTVVCGSSVTINVLANDTDPNGDALTITGISGLNPALGTATIVNNQIVFVPASGVTGNVVFQYSISDGKGGTDTANVTVTITNTPPDARDDSASTAHNTAVTVNVLANDTDAECIAGLAITGISGVNNAHGSAQIVNGQIRFTPANGFSGTTSFQYTITDGCGGYDTATVTITVGAAPPPPPPPPPPVSPIVIDLDGTGWHITAAKDSQHGFDLTGDGVIHDTAWFGNTMGILARDRDGDGIITGIHEVFGNDQMDGYTELRMLEDTNGDGVIDANDDGWEQLRIWIDANGDGIGTEDELFSLAYFGIVSIDAIGVEDYINLGSEAFISHTGTVTLADGSTLNSADVWFNLPGSANSDIVVDAAVLAAATGDDVAAMPANVAEQAIEQAYVAPVETAQEEQPLVVIH